MSLFARWAVVLAFPVTGCVSIVSVEKATPASTGVRFNLPEVFIQLVPKADGTLEVKKHFLPDPRNEYVVKATSLLGNYTIDVQRHANNLLDTVGFDTDTTAVVKQLVTSAATVRSAEIEAAAAKAKTEAADAKAAADKAGAALETAMKASEEAKVALSLAEAKVGMLEERSGETPPPSGLQDQVFAAKLAAAEARIKLEAANRALDQAAARHGNARRASGAPIPVNRAAAMGPGSARGNGAAAQPPRIVAPDTIFYRVEMKKDGVLLREAFPQELRETWRPPPVTLE